MHRQSYDMHSFHENTIHCYTNNEFNKEVWKYMIRTDKSQYKFIIILSASMVLEYLPEML